LVVSGLFSNYIVKYDNSTLRYSIEAMSGTDGKDTFKAVESMKPGDIFYFKKPELASFQPNGIPAFEVHVGTLGGQTAVQVERAVSPGQH
jgi:hypothetical protein